MTSRERVEIALKGGKPDRIPIAAIYDMGYVTSSTGRDQREFITATSEEKIRMIEDSFQRHAPIDCFFVHGGSDDRWRQNHRIEKFPDYWMVTDITTGKHLRLLPDGCWAEEDGTPIRRDPSIGGISQIQTEEDIERLVIIPTENDLEQMGRYGPLKNLVSKYPDVHFSFQSGSPMISALGFCGGYEEGLTLLAGNPGLFKKLIERCSEYQASVMAPGKKAGGLSTWFTSYYTGADTISPKIYTEVVFPAEYRVCREAKNNGLFVLDWFLGDIMPVLDVVMKLPIDALVLEQGRKGYNIDPVEIRKKVGDRFCLFGYAFENDFCTFNRAGLTAEIRRQIEGAGKNGAFIAGMPIMPPNANPDAVDYYISEVLRLGRYW
jgi:uroporphyrinogen-III decarboxylase